MILSLRVIGNKVTKMSYRSPGCTASTRSLCAKSNTVCGVWPAGISSVKKNNLSAQDSKLRFLLGILRAPLYENHEGREVYSNWLANQWDERNDLGLALIGVLAGKRSLIRERRARIATIIMFIIIFTNPVVTNPSINETNPYETNHAQIHK